MQVRCVDAAREAARLVARGDRESAVTTARRIAPEDASISVEIVDGFAVAVVSAESALLPLVDISSEAVAAVESGVEEECTYVTTTVLPRFWLAAFWRRSGC